MGAAITSLDGLARSNGSAAGNNFVAAYGRACIEQAERKRVWTASMRRFGAKIVTPDDGWVDRDRHRVCPPSYASVHDIAHAGDLIALGTPERWRVVRILRVEPNWAGYLAYYFESRPVAHGGVAH